MTNVEAMIAFLLAQIAEDAAVASAADGEHWIMSDGDRTVELLERIPASRVLAECEAHRQIVADSRSSLWGVSSEDDLVGDEEKLAWGVLLRLAAVYGDRPGYDKAWRP